MCSVFKAYCVPVPSINNSMPKLQVYAQSLTIVAVATDTEHPVLLGLGLRLWAHHYCIKQSTSRVG
jgi:hypothetical protein